MNRSLNRIKQAGRILSYKPGFPDESIRVAPLGAPDTYHLSAAEGWLGLENWREAAADLEKIRPGMREHPNVLEVRCQVAVLAQNWAEALPICQKMTLQTPGRSFGWLYLSYVLNEMDRTNEAYDTLFYVLYRFPRDSVMRYCMACLACKLGLLAEASAWLRRAFELGDAHALMSAALTDPDLKPMWAGMGLAGKDNARVECQATQSASHTPGLGSAKNGG